MRKWLTTLVIIFLVGDISAQEIRSVKAVELQKIIAESRTPLIVNMWATWCKPCIEELPYFLAEWNKHREDSLQLVLVSLDFKEAFPGDIEAFARKRKIGATILWLDETNADYFCPKVDSKWSGAIPATLFINNKTGYRNFIDEQVSHEKLEKEIMAVLKKN